MWDRIEGAWKQMTGSVKQQWGRLTDDDMTVIAGKRDQLLGKIQERYGYATDKAEAEIHSFEKRMAEAAKARS
jgi:uncharacterized protein YjbJ (UPF0337 family)